MADLVAKDAFDRLPETYRRRAREIAARVREIDALMAPCNLDAIRDAVIRLRRQLRPQPDTDPAGMADAFKAACRDLPEWALSEAANDFLFGRVDNHTGQFMPTCAEFAKRARSIMLPFLSERAALRIEASKLVERAEDEHRRHLIAIERHDPAVRQRVATMVAEATAGMVKGALRAEHGRLTDQAKAKFDALRKPRGFESKIEQTRIVKGR